MKRALLVVLAFTACRDFDGAVGACIDAGICVEGGAGGGSAGGATGGGSTGGGATGGGSTGGGSTGGGSTGGGSTGGGSAGGGSGVGGGTATGGGVSGTGGGYVAMLDTGNVSVARGTWGFLIAEIDREDPFDDTTLHFDVQQPDGGASLFRVLIEDQDTMFSSTDISVVAPEGIALGTYPHVLRVTEFGTSTLLASVGFDVTVRAPRPLLVVDDDIAGANQGGDWRSAEDTPWDTALQARSAAYDRVVIPYDFAMGASDISPTVLASYGAVIWQNGTASSGAVAFIPQNEAALTAWLGTGSKKLVLSSPGWLSRVTGNWTSSDNAFLSDQVGAQGFRYSSSTMTHIFSSTSGTVTVPYGVSINLVGYVNPAPETQVLFTETTPDSGFPVATRHVTDAGSTVVYMGFNMEHVLGSATTKPVNQAGSLTVVLDAAGIP